MRKSDVVFVVPRGLGHSGFPFGVGILAGILRRNGYAVSVVDANAHSLSERETVSGILERGPRVVGFTGLLSNYDFLRRTSLLLRQQNDAVKQLAGGWWCSPIPRTVLQETDVDVVVRGEADLIITKVCDAMLSGRPPVAVQGVCFHTADGSYCSTGESPSVRELDRLPEPAYELFEMSYYVVPRGRHYFLQNSYWDEESFAREFKGIRRWTRANMYSGRGCYGRCTFCGAAGVARRNHSPGYVADHMARMGADFGANFFRFTESLTLSTKKWTKAFCREILSRDLRVLYWAQCRGDFRWDDETLDLLKASGCYHVQIGFESGDNRMLACMRKNTTVEKYHDIIAAFRKHGIWVTGSFALNMPGEDGSSLARTTRFARDARLVSSSGFAVPNPGSELYEYARSHGFLELGKESCSQLANINVGYGKRSIEEYVKRFNFNALTTRTLCRAQNDLVLSSRIAWFYSKNRFVYWCFRLFPMILRGERVEQWFRERLVRQHMSSLPGQVVQGVRLLLSGLWLSVRTSVAASLRRVKPIAGASPPRDELGE